MWLEISVPVESQEAARSVSQLFDLYGEGGAVQERVCTELHSPGPSSPGPLTVKTYLPLDGGGEQRLHALRQELARLTDLDQIPPARFKKLEKKDWATAWKAFLSKSVIIPYPVAALITPALAAVLSTMGPL